MPNQFIWLGTCFLILLEIRQTLTLLMVKSLKYTLTLFYFSRKYVTNSMIGVYQCYKLPLYFEILIAHKVVSLLKGVFFIKYYMTLVSAFATLVAYLIPILSFNKVFNGNLYFYSGFFIIIILIMINIISAINGDRIVNSLLCLLTLVALLIFTFPIWKVLIF